MDTINWGSAPAVADIMAPGDIAGHGRCAARQWGVPVDGIVVYSSRAGLRRWAQSIIDRLPPDRTGTPLVTVDAARQMTWLDAREAATDPDWTARVVTMCDLLQALAADPGAAGWTLGDDVARVWASLDETTSDLIAGVVLAGTGHHVGIGAPLTDADLSVRARLRVSNLEWANACLLVVADRINTSY